MRATRVLAVALLALSALAAVCAADKNVWLVRATPVQGNEWLRQGHDVRAFLEGSVLILTELDGEMPEGVERRTPLGTLRDGERMAILEPGADHTLFRAEVVEVLAQPTVRRLSPTFSTRVVVVAYTSDDVELMINNLMETESILVSAKPLRVIDNSRLAARLAGRKRANEFIFDLIERINEQDAKAFAMYLSGEDPESPFNSRHSQSDDSLLAGDWVGEQFENFGFSVSREYFRQNYCTNVIAEITGVEEPDSIVILGAHLDDREANILNITGRAPGANDDGSGSTMLLLAAKAIYESGIRFRRTLRIMAYCGEEQGLYGSRHHAAECRNNNVDVYAMLQGDMIAVKMPEDKLGVALVNRYTDPTLTELVEGYVATYVPELAISSQSACCSDHQSFYEEGYPSAGFVEPLGYIGDPKYHHVEDLVNRETYSIEQLTLIARAMVASIAELAEPLL